MKLVYDNVTRTTTNAPGVTTRVPGFGNSTTVEWLDPSHRSPTGYFKDIVNALVPLGYERGVSVRGAPFDFRRAPSEYCRKNLCWNNAAPDLDPTLVSFLNVHMLRLWNDYVPSLQRSD